MNADSSFDKSIDYKNGIVLKLIYFWAYVEAGLAGLLHFLHIPLTGYIAGGFSIIINVLIVHFSENKTQNLLKALSIVLAVKFILSPYTPWGAYVAVCFQGLLAVILFNILSLNRLSIMLYALICMLESAIQKPLIAYLFLGNEFWHSVYKMVISTFHISNEQASLSIQIISIFYLGSFLGWAFFIAFIANKLKVSGGQMDVTNQQKSTLKNLLIEDFGAMTLNTSKKKIAISMIVLISIALLFLPIFINQMSWFYVARLIFLFALFIFVFPYLIKKHQSFLFQKHQKIATAIVSAIPLIQKRTFIAWELTKGNKWLYRIKQFVYFAIWLNVFYIDETNRNS